MLSQLRGLDRPLQVALPVRALAGLAQEGPQGPVLPRGLGLVLVQPGGRRLAARRVQQGPQQEPRQQGPQQQEPLQRAPPRLECLLRRLA